MRAVDAFADADLRCEHVEHWTDYPRDCEKRLAELRGPWMYTGAMENHLQCQWPDGAIAGLIGCDKRALTLARDPWFVQRLLANAQLPFLTVAESPIPGRQWTRKPLKSAGGWGIRLARPEDAAEEGYYYQAYLAGASYSASYLATWRNGGPASTLIGFSAHFCSDNPSHLFRYQGCMGPYPVSDQVRSYAECWGRLLAEACGLRGLFGIDFVIDSEGIPYPTEVNPRYTASMELFDLAWEESLVALHVAACWQGVHGQLVHRARGAISELTHHLAKHEGARMWGKYCVYAPKSLVVPSENWQSLQLFPREGIDPWSIADAPRAGSTIEAEQPLFTLRARSQRGSDLEFDLRTAAQVFRHHVLSNWPSKEGARQ